MDSPSRALVEALGGLESPALDTQAALRLGALLPEEAARALDELAREAGEVRERRVFAALCRAVVFGAPGFPTERRRAVRHAAAALGLQAVTALFTEATAEPLPDDNRAPNDRDAGAATLGHRKQLARAADRDRIARLARDLDPTVIRELLLNPRLTEDIVVRIASRRPTSPDVLEEVARSPRWAIRRSVRRALALNPHCDPAVVNPLLPHLTSADLHEIADASTLHPAVRSAAAALLDARAV